MSKQFFILSNSWLAWKFNYNLTEVLVYAPFEFNVFFPFQYSMKSFNNMDSFG